MVVTSPDGESPQYIFDEGAKSNMRAVGFSMLISEIGCMVGYGVAGTYFKESAS